MIVKLWLNTILLTAERAFENVISNMSAILLKPKYHKISVSNGKKYDKDSTPFYPSCVYILQLLLYICELFHLIILFHLMLGNGVCS